MERSRRTELRVALYLALAAAGGATRFSASASVTALPEESQERSTTESHDDLLVRVEKRAPGFGGMFIGRDGRLAVYLLDPSQLAAARSAIEAVFGPERVPAAGVRALKGQYTVSQLKRWTERAGGLLEMPRVTMVDLDEAKNRVAVGIEDESRRRAAEQALVSRGIPREAVVIEVTGPIRQLDRPQPKRGSTGRGGPRSASPAPR